MTREEAYATWAPVASPWAVWAKPVLFNQFGKAAQTALPPWPDDREQALPRGDGGTAIVVDLPGSESVQVGLALAGRGFVPVPAFNGTSGENAVVDVLEVLRGLRSGAAELAAHPPAAEGPPAFLIDSRRMDGPVRAGQYDNRWIVVPQDFPSVTFLRAGGIRVALLIRRGTDAVSADLLHVLLRWKEGGLRLRALDADTGLVQDDLAVPVPRLYRRAWYRAVSLRGLHRHRVVGFGASVRRSVGPSHGSR